MEIRLFKPEDVEKCLNLMDLSKDNLSDLFTKEEFLVHAENNSIWIIEEDDNIIGMISFWDLRNGIGMFGSLVVHPDHQRKGVGNNLVEHVKKDCEEKGYRKLMCITRVKNLPMIFLSLKKGFIMEGLLKGGFRDGNDAYYLSYFYQAKGEINE